MNVFNYMWNYWFDLLYSLTVIFDIYQQIYVANKY